MSNRYDAGSRNRIFSVMLFGTVLGSLLQTSLPTLLPQIMLDLGITASGAQWLNTVYSLAMGVMIPASAFLLHRFKTRNLYLVSVCMFILGLTLCSFTNSFPIMIVGRIMQAIGSGMSMSMLQVVILTIFPKEERGSAMGIYGIACSFAPSFAPTLAGIIAETYGWRMIFQGSLVLYGVNFVLALIFMKNVLANEKVSFDLVSFMTCAIGFTGVTVGLGNISENAFLSAWVLVPLLVGAIALFVFTRRQLKADHPFLDVRVLGNFNCKMAVILSMLLYAGLIAGTALTPMFNQMICGLSPSASGMTMLPGSLCMALISPVTGKLYDRYGIGRLAIVGSALMLASSLGYCLLTAEASAAMLIFLFILKNLSVGCLMMPLVTWGMSSLLPSQTAHGTAILTSLRTVAGAIGSALLVGLMSTVSRTELFTAKVTMGGMRAAFIGLAVIAALQLVLSFTIKPAAERKIFI